MNNKFSRLLKIFSPRTSSIVGKVSMSSTGLPISEVVIRQVNSGKSTTSDYMGNYRLPVNAGEDLNLEVSFDFPEGQRSIYTPSLALGGTKSPYRLDFEF